METVDVAIVGGGFTGLSTAYNLRKDNPGMTVAVLESEIIGYGASGRNGGFSMTLFGMEPTITKLLFGQQRAVEAHRYMERAVDYVDALVKEHQMQSDYWFPGFLRVATTSGPSPRDVPPLVFAAAAVSTSRSTGAAASRSRWPPELTTRLSRNVTLTRSGPTASRSS